MPFCRQRKLPVILSEAAAAIPKASLKSVILSGEVLASLKPVILSGEVLASLESVILSGAQSAQSKDLRLTDQPVAPVSTPLSYRNT